MFSGDFLVWFAAGEFSVLDLITGNGFDVPAMGAATANADSIVIMTPTNPPTGRFDIVASRVSSIANLAAPPIPNCH